MRTIRFLSIIFFLAVFINGKASAPIIDLESKKDISCKITNVGQKVNTDDQDDDSTHKRKRRPRGIEVDVPHISDISFEQLYAYNDFEPLWIEKIYSSFLHCVHLQRGPPLV